MDEIKLAAYDWILVNSSAGKDSQAMLDVVVERAGAEGVLDHRVVVVHCDLGRVEWAGTRELAERQAKAYGVRFEVVSRPQGDLLDHVAKRGMWPSPKNRYCTSDHKRGQVRRLMTQLVRESEARGDAQVIQLPGRRLRRRQIRILNCMGMRADESPARAKLLPFVVDPKASNTKREVTNWLPIHAWTANQVWGRIRLSQVPHHYAYDLGMPRLSCCFCIFAPPRALVLAGQHNRDLLHQYVAVERQTGHKFRQDVTLEQILARVESGEVVPPGELQGWCM